MFGQKKKMIPVTVYLTPQQIREAYHRLAKEEQIEKETSSLIESDMSDYLSELVVYEEMLAKGKIKWK